MGTADKDVFIITGNHKKVRVAWGFNPKSRVIPDKRKKLKEKARRKDGYRD